MTTIQELRNQLVTITNSPHLPAEIDLAIKQAILNLHHLDFFWRDNVQGVINLTSGRQARHEIPLSNFPRLRAVKHVRPYFASESCGPAIPRLAGIGSKQHEFYFVSSTALVVQSNSPTNQFQLSYWENPNLAPDGEFSSWIADLYPTAVQDAAAAQFFDMTGDPAKANQYRSRVGNRNAIGSHANIIVQEQLEIIS